MGTRGFTGFVVDDEVKISYQQFDSYPSGVGMDVLKWLRVAVDSVTALRERVRQIEMVQEDSKPTAAQIEKFRKYADERVGSGSVQEWYSLLRENQGRPDRFVEAGVMLDAGDFPLDSLFAEWGYVVDLDAETFEVYRGFQASNENPTIIGRWADQVPDPDDAARQDKIHGYHYLPVSRVALWPLNELPTDEEFLQVEKDVYGAEDDD